MSLRSCSPWKTSALPLPVRESARRLAQSKTLTQWPNCHEQTGARYIPVTLPQPPAETGDAPRGLGQSSSAFGGALWLALLSGLLCLLASIEAQAAQSPANSPRQVISLDGAWEFQRNGAPSNTWKTVLVPSSFQSHEGTNFHGIGWYRKRLDTFALPPGQRVLIQFQAAATEAEAWFDGCRLGSHLGGWTPFRFEVTDLVRRAAPGTAHELKVRLDEKVGHNTQGFLPVIAPHFGGLWQGVSLLFVPETYCDDLALRACGDIETEELRLEIPLAGSAPEAVTNVLLRCRLLPDQPWSALSNAIQRSGNVRYVRAPVPHPRWWSPAEPNLYELELCLGPNAPLSDRVRTRVAFRKFEAFGPQLRLNGRPINIRGLLNWGYSGPQVEPNPGETVWRRELELARSLGFNLMKFCLWVPPQRYLELADETGMLTWMEYPTWHPNLTEQFLEPLRREFREFFLYDRNHPSVVLRSLTCETGPSAEVDVIRSLYDSAHELIPGSLVEDDSSWIGWNRINDFYDDHPYGNNHTWLNTLAGFNEYVLGHGLKPLVLGESISADTWIDRAALLKHFGNQRPWWAPAVLDDTGRWLERMRAIAGPGGLEQLEPDSLRYGLLMRKYQIEAYRREIPYGGYVITVIRDFPSCSMGFLDYLDRAKWPASDWAWQRDTICLLKTEGDRRSFTAGEPLTASILLSHFGFKPVEGASLHTTLDQNGAALSPACDLNDIHQAPGTLAQLTNLSWNIPQFTNPVRVAIHVDLRSPQCEWGNQWPLWVVPPMAPDSLRNVQIHSSLSADLARELFHGCSSLLTAKNTTDNSPTVVVASHFDDELVRLLENGGRVLLLPDGQRFSLPLKAHWFLRGAPYIPDRPLGGRLPRDLLLELQHFDLASEVVPDLPQLDSWDPHLLLWDTHDQKSIKTHGLVFETRAAKGRVLVSTLRLNGPHNAAGHWLVGVLLDHLRLDPPPRHQLPADVWSHLKARLHAHGTLASDPSLDLLQ